MDKYSNSMPISSARDLGATVRKWRKQGGLTQIEAAGLMNVGVRFLSELENGKATIQFDRLLKVLTGLGLQLTLGPAIASTHRTNGNR